MQNKLKIGGGIPLSYEAFGRLRAMNKDDLAQVLAWRNAPAVRHNMYTNHEISPDEHAAWFAAQSQRQDVELLIYETAAGKAAGFVSFSEILPQHHRATWAFYAAQEAPKGSGSLMEFLALEHFFAREAFDKLQCEVLSFNMPVVRLHQKFGFEIEGVFKRQYFRNDMAYDIYRLALTRDVWQQQRNIMFNKLAALCRAK